MARPEYLSLLGFSENWVSAGLLPDELLEALAHEFESGADRNPEHYRYRAFRRYLDNYRPLPAWAAEAFYSLGEQDADRAMGRAMMADVLGLPECPDGLRAKAAVSGDSHLMGLVRRLGLLAGLDKSLTPELFDRCLGVPDPVVHRALAGHAGLSRPQLERLADAGVNKAVRNMATARLGKRR
jgi:hypothetical protein